MEGGTYVCRWTRRNNEYVLSLDENPGLTVVDADFGDAADELASQIGLGTAMVRPCSTDWG